MGETKLLTQTAEGLLLPGEIGEKLVNHYSFYAAFSSPEEYILGVSGRIIGRLPIDRPVAEGSLIIFAGRRWRVLRVDSEHKRIDLVNSTGGGFHRTSVTQQALLPMRSALRCSICSTA